MLWTMQQVKDLQQHPLQKQEMLSKSEEVPEQQQHLATDKSKCTLSLPLSGKMLTNHHVRKVEMVQNIFLSEPIPDGDMSDIGPEILYIRVLFADQSHICVQLPSAGGEFTTSSQLLD